MYGSTNPTRSVDFLATVDDMMEWLSGKKKPKTFWVRLSRAEHPLFWRLQTIVILYWSLCYYKKFVFLVFLISLKTFIRFFINNKIYSISIFKTMVFDIYNRWRFYILYTKITDKDFRGLLKCQKNINLFAISNFVKITLSYRHAIFKRHSYQ